MLRLEACICANKLRMVFTFLNGCRKKSRVHIGPRGTSPRPSGRVPSSAGRGSAGASGARYRGSPASRRARTPPALSSAGSPPPGAWPCAPRPPPRASPVGLCVARPPAVAFVSSAAHDVARPPRIAPCPPVRRLPGPAGAAVALARRLGGRAGKRSFLSTPEAESPRSRHRWV